MASGLLILLMFAGLGLSSNAATPRNWYGLSASQSAVLQKNVANFDAATIAYRDAFKSLFKVLYDTKAKSGNNRGAKVSEAILRMRDGVYLSYDSLRTTTKTSSTADDAARRASYQYLKDAALEVSSAVKLVQSANGQINQNTFEGHRTAAQESFKKLAQQFYSLISTSLNTKNAEVLAVIKNSLDKSSLSLVHMNNAIFNAIKVWAAAPTAAGYADRLFRSNMEDLEDKALYGIRDVIQYNFGTVSTLFIYTQLNKEGILSKLAANQNALFGSHREYANANDELLKGILRYLQRIQLGFNDDGDLDFSQDDVAVAATTQYYDTGDSIHFALFSLLHPDASAQISVIQETLATSVNSPASESFFLALRKAGILSNYTEAISTIEAVKTSIRNGSPLVAGSYVNAIRGNQSYSAEVETKLTTLTQNIADANTYGIDLFMDSLVIVANAAKAGKVTEDDINTVKANAKAANGFFEFCEYLSEATFLVILS